MSDSLKPGLVGGFTLGALVLAVIGVLLFGGGQIFRSKSQFVCFFEGSVKGLRVGAPVSFRGVRVGVVSDLDVILAPETGAVDIQVMLEFPFDENLYREFDQAGEDPAPGELVAVLIREHGLRARLALESPVTGQLYVDLDLYSHGEPRLRGRPVGYPEMPTMESGLERLQRTFETIPIDEIAFQFADVLSGLDRLINSAEITAVLQDSRATMAELRELLAVLRPPATELSASAERLLARSELVLTRADDLLQRSEPTLDALGRLSLRADRESVVLFRTMAEFGESGLQVMAQAQTALEQLNGLTAPGSPTQRQISLALQELTAAARTMRSFTEYLQRNPNALLTGKSRQPR